MLGTRAQNGVLAVIPFADLDPDSSTAYLASGVTNAVAGTLVRAGHLRVVAPTGAAAKATDNPIDIGRRLHATLLLEGTVQSVGTKLRVTARLTRISDGVVEWAEVYDRDTKDLFAVQDNIASAIVSAVTRADASASIAAASDAHALPPDIYDAFLRGQYDLSRRNEASLGRAVANFRRVTQSAPQFAPGWSSLAEAYALGPEYGYHDTGTLPKLAVEAAQKAVVLDPDAGEVYAARALAYNSQWRWEDAEKDFVKAISLSPRSAAIHEWYGEQLLVRGKLAQAIVQLSRAAQLNPTSARIQGTLAVAFARGGLAKDARQAADEALLLDPTLPAVNVMRGAALLMTRDTKGAVAQLERALVLDSSSVGAMGLAGYAYSLDGNAPRAKQMLSRVESLTPESGKDIAIARIKLGLGDKTGALDALEHALAIRDPFFYTESLKAPPFAALIGDRRYAAMMAAVGLDSV